MTAGNLDAFIRLHRHAADSDVANSSSSSISMFLFYLFFLATQKLGCAKNKTLRFVSYISELMVTCGKFLTCWFRLCMSISTCCNMKSTTVELHITPKLVSNH